MNTLTLNALDPELSFGIDSIGRNKKFLVGKDNNIILFSEDMWELGVKTYDMCSGKYETMTIPCSLKNHNENLQECSKILDSMVEHIQKLASEGFIKNNNGENHPETHISGWSKHDYKHKLELVNSFLTAISDLSDENSYKLGLNLFFYGVMHLLDQYITLDLPWSEESTALFDSIKDINHLIELRVAIENAISKKAKNAVKSRHKKIDKIKAELKNWHRENRQEFLKNNGTLNQTDAAEHVCYVLRLTTLKPKKVAEYMGEFEREFQNSSD